ncbi:MAG: helix-turn-helix domain-containing protein [Bacteroidota bacterium]
MTPQEIKALLMLKNIKQKDIALELDVTEGAVSQVIYGSATARRIRQAIAEKLGKSESELWPSNSKIA